MFKEKGKGFVRGGPGRARGGERRVQEAWKRSEGKCRPGVRAGASSLGKGDFIFSTFLFFFFGWKACCSSMEIIEGVGIWKEREGGWGC